MGLFLLAFLHRRQIRFVAVGGCCFIVQLAVMLTLLHMGSQKSFANTTGFLVGAELKYVLSARFVWADRPTAATSERWSRLLSFNGATIVALAVNAVVFAIADGPLGVLFATVTGVMAGTVISYVICDLSIFRVRTPVAGLPSPRVSVETGSVLSAHPGLLDDREPTARAPMWLVIPAYNEEARLDSTLAEYRATLAFDDHLVIVVNGSVDGTEAIARRSADVDPRIHVLVDPDRIGKGGAIRAGLGFVFANADPSDVVCYTDADAAVNGNEIDRLGAMAVRGELTVGSRWCVRSTQIRPQPLGRRIASRTFNQCVRRVVGLSLADTQCPAKAMIVGDLPPILYRLDSSGFAFDVDVILAAKQAGIVPRECPVVWADQDGSTVRVRSAAPKMLGELLRLRRKYAIQGGESRIAVDLRDRPDAATVPGADRRTEHVVAAIVPGNLPPSPARRKVLSPGQKAVLVAAAGALGVGLVISAVVTAVVVNSLLVAFFTLANLLKLVLIRRSLNDPCTVVVDLSDPPNAVATDLPVYTILLPVYREAAVLRQLVDGISRLDYPSDRLDVKLLLEDDDTETRDAVATLDLPTFIEVLVVPDVGPAGKPRACNYGLAHARGEYLVIYDAEDCPDSDQLRKSVVAFSQMSADIVCLQAKLNYFNRVYNVLTRWFTAEYSLWFDQLLPGLQSLDVAIPLGGTSNHFVTARLRELGGWDAHNVTEDADLGIRIFVRGWKTAILDSTTYEEATSGCRNWVRQRSRWVKGYMQTYLFHMRHPVRLGRQMRPKALVVFQLFFGAGTLCLLLNPLYWMLTVLWFAGHPRVIELIFPRPVLYLGTSGLFLGNAAFTLATMSGSFGRRHYDDVKWALLSPVYWVLMSVAAWKALIQLCYRPDYWEKTIHGVCRYEADVVTEAAPVSAGPLEGVPTMG